MCFSFSWRTISAVWRVLLQCKSGEDFSRWRKRSLETSMDSSCRFSLAFGKYVHTNHQRTGGQPPVGVLQPFLKSFPKQRPSMTGRRGERHKYVQVQLNCNCNLTTRAQDTFSKLMDTSILIAGRSFEQGNWIRRSGAKELNGRASPTPKSLSMGSSLPLTDISNSPI